METITERWWDYGLIRDINMSIENIDKYGTDISADEKLQFKAESLFYPRLRLF